MTESTSSFNPSAQVERVREIIVGRQLGRVEQRLERLEGFLTNPQLPQQDVSSRLENIEAQLEAANARMEKQVASVRLDFSGEIANRKAEAHRLAEQIQNQVQAKQEQARNLQSVQELDQNIRTWQSALQSHLEQRESWLIGKLRDELERQRKEISNKIAELETTQNSQNKFHREQAQKIAQAAQALLEATDLTTHNSNSLTPH